MFFIFEKDRTPTIFLCMYCKNFYYIAKEIKQLVNVKVTKRRAFGKHEFTKMGREKNYGVLIKKSVQRCLTIVSANKLEASGMGPALVYNSKNVETTFVCVDNSTNLR